MDAISFVLGEKTSNLRVRNLRVSAGPVPQVLLTSIMSSYTGPDPWRTHWQASGFTCQGHCLLHWRWHRGQVHQEVSHVWARLLSGVWVINTPAASWGLPLSIESMGRWGVRERERERDHVMYYTCVHMYNNVYIGCILCWLQRPPGTTPHLHQGQELSGLPGNQSCFLCCRPPM